MGAIRARARALRIYDVCDPVDGLSHAMIDTRLARLRARVTGGNYADQVPSTGLLQHQRAAAVTLRRSEQNSREFSGRATTAARAQTLDSLYK